MSIKILSPEEIKAGHKFQQPVLLFPHLTNLYNHRRERLMQLAESHPLKDYLLFVAKLVAAQQKALREFPLTEKLDLTPEQLAHYPLDARIWKRDAIWLDIFKYILAEVKVDANETLLTTIEGLEKTSDKELNELADKLLQEDFSAVSSDKAVFIWAALMVYWRLLANGIPHSAIMESGQNLTHCPVCHAAPTASIVHMGSEQGLRYLHCSLCETEWNVVRVKCTNCDHTGKISYFMFDKEFAPIRTETCDDCKSYLKIFYQEKDPHLDVLADDLASIFLDMKTDEKGYARSGLNPYLFMDQE